jgi:hypothetical protein
MGERQWRIFMGMALVSLGIWFLFVIGLVVWGIWNAVA